jgi:hypothetical protein
VTGVGLQIYVYYRVPHSDVAALIIAVRHLQAELATALPGLLCGLSQRVETGAELLTLMETYAHPSGLTAAWQRELEERASARLADWTIGARHVECFAPCA